MARQLEAPQEAAVTASTSNSHTARKNHAQHVHSPCSLALFLAVMVPSIATVTAIVIAIAMRRSSNRKGDRENDWWRFRRMRASADLVWPAANLSLPRQRV